jgi:serine phosphatase RsbU (regulator of sigma subunit)
VSFDEVTHALEAQRRAIAEKLEFERRLAQELEIAKQVQAQLFPQTSPPLRTLEYAGTCIQARKVGGDYYDFLDLGQERLGFVIGDISGKGIAAALLMANLQANLRSQCAIAVDQPQRFLRSVNQLFCENTPNGAFATLFFAEYDDKGAGSDVTGGNKRATTRAAPNQNSAESSVRELLLFFVRLVCRRWR